MNDGTRTHDRLDHNQELYQLSYVHRDERACPRPRQCSGGSAVGLVRRRGSGWSWDGVDPRRYAEGAERHVLVSAADGAADVELRYFRIPAGGASALERHPHEHAILVLHGRAEVLLGDDVHLVGEGDAVFVASEELHQLRAVGDDALGFLCTALVARGH